MIRPRFESIRLEYGCHSGRFDFPGGDRPAVIAGRNGSGKTTLLEALLRGLYGFVRRKPEERSLVRAREPWSGRPAEIEVFLLTPEGARIVIRREVDTDEVVVRERETDRELFRGDANPVGARSASRRYQELVREWIGFSSLEPYRETAWIAQGELVHTRLDDELLRAAAGTHRRVEAALTELREAFESMTLQPLESGGRRKTRPRLVEELREAEDQLSRRLVEARAARDAKGPVLQRAGEVRGELVALEAEIAVLEAAYRPITERRSLLAEQREIEARLSALSDAVDALRQAREDLERMESDAADAVAGGRYPEDFEARLGRAEELWDRRAALEEGARDSREGEPVETSPLDAGALTAGVILGLAGVVVWSTASSLGGGVMLLLSAALLARTWLGRRAHAAKRGRADREARRSLEELEAVRSRLEEIGADLPEPPLTPSSLARHRRTFRRQVELVGAVRMARERLREATDAAGRLLPREVSADVAPIDVERLLRDTREDTRTTLARVQLRLEEQPSAPPLPEGVEANVPAVEAARDERRAHRDDLRNRLSEAELELRELDRTGEDVFPLERELDDIRSRRQEAGAETLVRKYAWELVSDAYERFRSTDQDRLLACINRRLAPLSGGRLGPAESIGDLADARVRVGDRIVALDSPPLSFGEKHLVLLAIRLGAADFVAGSGVRHPLLVDEPFTHLDEERAQEVWELLRGLAKERQVIITTQDRLVLDHLGIRPDIDLVLPESTSGETEGPAAASAAAAEPPPTATPEADSEPVSSPDRPSSTTQAQLELG